MNSVCILALKSEHKNLEYCSVFCEIPVSGLNNVKEEAVLWCLQFHIIVYCSFYHFVDLYAIRVHLHFSTALTVAFFLLLATGICCFPDNPDLRMDRNCRNVWLLERICLQLLTEAVERFASMLKSQSCLFYIVVYDINSIVVEPVSLGDRQACLALLLWTSDTLLHAWILSKTSVELNI